MILDDDNEDRKFVNKESIHKNWVAKDDPFKYKWKDDEEIGKKENI